MGFLDRLKRGVLAPPVPSNGLSALPTPRMGIAGGGDDDLGSMLSSIEPFINRMRNRDLNDLREEVSIMNPPIRPDRIRTMFNPAQQTETAPANVVLQPNMTDFQRGSLDLEHRKIAQTGALGAERVGLDRERVNLAGQAQQLNELKNDQIYDTKLREIERKATEAESRLEFATKQLQSNENSAMARDQLGRAQLEATTARHALELAQKDSQFAATNDIAQKRLEAYQQAIEDAGYLLQEDELSTDPTTGAQKRVRITRRGDPAKNDTKKKDPLGLRSGVD